MIDAVGPIDDEIAEIDDESTGNRIDAHPIAGGRFHFEAAFFVLGENGDPAPIRMRAGTELIELRIGRLRRVAQQPQRGFLVLEGRIRRSRTASPSESAISRDICSPRPRNCR